MSEFEDGIIYADLVDEPIVIEINPLLISDQIDTLRHQEYTKLGGADALYMKWQAGEATEAEWLAERERVRLLYPDTTE